jgi:hypothetical protein
MSDHNDPGWRKRQIALDIKAKNARELGLDYEPSMTKDEALKLTLEALESADWYIDQLEMLVYSVDDDGTHENRAKVQVAITAIKAALAQPVQEPMHPQIKKMYEDYFDKCFKESSAPQRTWVGLTDEEIADYLGDEYHDMCESELEFFRLGVAAAKEKNT